VIAGLFSDKFQKEYDNTLLDTIYSAIGSTHTLFYNNKEDFATNHTYQKVIEERVRSAKFIKYGNQQFTNVLIWDMDDFSELGYFPTIVQMHDHFYNLTGIEPTWTLSTDKGYHIAVVLDHGIFLTNQDGKSATQISKALIRLKRTITELIGADTNGSNRLTGIWRNPFTHDRYITGKLHDIDELLEIMDIQIEKPKKIQRVQGSLDLQSPKLKIKTTTKIAKSLQAGYYIGNRNHYIFSYGYKIKFESREINDNTLLDMMQSENSKHGAGLTLKEVSDIWASVLKLSETMYSPNQAISKRGKLSDEMWELKIHGLSNRRAYAGLITSRDRAKKTLKTIISTGVDLLEQGKQFNTKLIASMIEKHSKTVKRYEKTYNLKAMIFKLWHEKVMKRASSPKPTQKIDIRPFVLNQLLHDLYAEIDRKFSELVRRDCYLSIGMVENMGNVA
jgi:hypothetical protein